MIKELTKELPEGIRFIEFGDIEKHVKSFVPEMDKFTLEDYYRWSLEKNSLVIVREMENNIAGVLYLTIQDHIMIEMVIRNKFLPESKGAGGDLIKVVEKIIARYYNKNEIRLEAMDQVVDYYDHILKYEKYDEPYEDKDWGVLTPMKKRLTLS